MQALNTHTYDGHLLPLKQEFSSLLDDPDKEKEIEKLRELITDTTALSFFDKIVLNRNHQSNFDKSNGLYAFDLLYILAVYREKIPINTFEEQLCDMETGFCPEGKTTRLYQLIITI